jgi:hypothetical protein
MKHSKMKTFEVNEITELYEGHYGHIIAYHVAREGSELHDVRSSIVNPHSITGKWDSLVAGTYAHADFAPPLPTPAHWHFPGAKYVSEHFAPFWNIIGDEGARIAGGSFNTVAGTHNLVTWESGYYCMSDGSKYEGGGGGDKREYIEPSCALPGKFNN